MDIITREVGPNLLNGCCVEAERARRVAMALEGLCVRLHENFHQHMRGLIQQIQQCGQMLRTIADLSQLHIARIPVVTDYLNELLPCFSRSLRDITGYIEDTSLDKEHRWRKMYHVLGAELPGTTLPARFAMYYSFLIMLKHLLTKSPEFDLNGLEFLRHRVYQLREARGIPPPSPIHHDQLIRQQKAMLFWEQETDAHWAEDIFTRPLPCRTEFKRTSRFFSRAYGPFHRLGSLDMTAEVKTLAKRTFDDDNVSVTFFLQGLEETPFLMVRQIHSGEPWASIKGAHELCIKRDFDSRLTLNRWSSSEGRSKPWAQLTFITWEGEHPPTMWLEPRLGTTGLSQPASYPVLEVVLFYCTFVCLKVRSPMFTKMRSEEYEIRKEKTLFQAQIFDDGFYHSLRVYEDIVTHRRRLHASVQDGELKNCPVWTAFLPVKMGPLKSWLLLKRPHVIAIRDISPYIFCQNYHPNTTDPRQSKFQQLELEFTHAQGKIHDDESALGSEWNYVDHRL
ncbi:uncharacterized protein PG998_013201 [Apiospora kogelbergensis]|uniref:uncharacterized protein n=1 Tax=Apiospora kogelbergensis TaxID=1337665 RepID=UPI00312E9FF7